MKNAAILAGGLGKRLRPLTDNMPKPMIDVDGKPLLQHQVELLARHGVERIFILSGYKAEAVENHFGDGSDFDTEIIHLREEFPLGTGGALRELKGKVDDDFLLLYGDVYVGADLSRMARYHETRKPLATLAVHPTDHPQDSDLVVADHDDMVLKLLRKPHEGKPVSCLGNAALFCLSPSILDHIPEGFNDLMHDIIPAVLGAGLPVAAYRTPEYIKDMGTPDRLERVRAHVTAGKPEAMSLEYPRPAVFLDRDGTLVKFVDLLHTPEELHLAPGAGDAVSRFNAANLLAVMLTNQPVVARNLCTMNDVVRIHDRLECMLAKHHGHLDLIRFCPHHPDSGYPGENPAFKIPCECRKPGIGMFADAAKRLNIDLEQSWMVGDTEADILAGKTAGCRTMLIGTNSTETEPDYRAANMTEAADIILQHTGDNT